MDINTNDAKEKDTVYEELRKRTPPPVLIVLEPVELPLKKEKKQ